MIIVKTPLRISLLGGGTDYPQWLRFHPGSVLGGTINKYSYIQARIIPDVFPYKSRIVYSDIELVQRNEDIQHKYVRELIKYFQLDDFNLEITHTADLPARSGTGSSSAFLAGLVQALYLIKWGITYPCGFENLSREVIHIEQKLLKEAVGFQDAIFAANGGFQHISFDKSHRDYFMAEEIFLSPQQLFLLNNHSMLFYLGGRKEPASAVAATYVNSLTENRFIMEELSILAKFGKRVLLDGNMEELAGLVEYGWELKKSLSANISNPLIDTYYSFAKKAGAWGGKVLGAGGNSCLYLLAPPAKQYHIEKVLPLARIAFQFEEGHKGSEVILNAP